MNATIVWFRQDLRTDDHPALCEAVDAGPVICLFIDDPAADGAWRPGAASRWWLHRSLETHSASLRSIGGRLIVRRGDSVETLLEVARTCGARRILASARWEPAARAHDQAVRAALEGQGIALELLGGSLLHDPDAIRTGTGGPFKVFTHFWRACMAHGFDEVPRRPPARIDDGSRELESLDVSALGLRPRVAWDAGLAAAWTPGEAGARDRWKRFAAGAIADYADGRDRCGSDGTSALSPHLHFGEISPRRLWHEMRKLERAWRAETGPEAKAALESLRVFRAELGWREFAHHVLAHFPRTPTEPLRPEFARFPWQSDASLLRAWEKGQTGYPLVDAGMRQLWTTGWMHNRVRMVVASFLVKHLLQPWTAGARWFWETLVDADLANNTLGWQWTAGCGADAAPYFRIFNPVVQGERFDADGTYVRRWIPELARLPDAWIHQPWSAPPLALSNAGVDLGGNYPRPIVDHAQARARALEALASLREDSRA